VPLLGGCSARSLPGAGDREALAAIRACDVRAPWWLGPVSGFTRNRGTSLRLWGLDGAALHAAAACLEAALERQGVAVTTIEGIPAIVEIDIAGRARDVRYPNLPDPVWRDRNGRRVRPRPPGAGRR
jgi:hypothetical protein